MLRYLFGKIKRIKRALRTSDELRARDVFLRCVAATSQRGLSLRFSLSKSFKRGVSLSCLRDFYTSKSNALSNLLSITISFLLFDDVLLRTFLQEGYVTISRMALVQEKEQATDDFYFWTSFTAFRCYVIVLAAMLFQRLWILYGILFILAFRMASIILRWVFYVLGDTEIRASIQFVKSWIYWAHQETKKKLNGETALSYMLALSVVNCMDPVTYVRTVLRYKNIELRKELLREMGVDRYEKSPFAKLFDPDREDGRGRKFSFIRHAKENVVEIAKQNVHDQLFMLQRQKSARNLSMIVPDDDR